ncbi:MAG: VOC family protein [Actinomycetota bacterium]
MTSASASLGLGEPYHVGLAVHDLDDAIRRFGEQFGIEKWAKLESEVPSTYRGAETMTGIRGALARQGSLLIELVQPTRGMFTAKTFLEERGEGVYHLGYWVEDMTAAIERADKLGIGVDWIFPASGDPFAVYLDATQTLGMHIELVSPAMKPIIDQALNDA